MWGNSREGAKKRAAADRARMRTVAKRPRRRTRTRPAAQTAPGVLEGCPMGYWANPRRSPPSGSCARGRAVRAFFYDNHTAKRALCQPNLRAKGRFFVLLKTRGSNQAAHLMLFSNQMIEPFRHGLYGASKGGSTPLVMNSPPGIASLPGYMAIASRFGERWGYRPKPCLGTLSPDPIRRPRSPYYRLPQNPFGGGGGHRPQARSQISVGLVRHTIVSRKTPSEVEAGTARPLEVVGAGGANEEEHPLAHGQGRQRRERVRIEGELRAV